MEKSGLTREVENKIREIFSSIPEIEKVILFGSRAKGTFKNGSDIDLTLQGKNCSVQTIYQAQDKLYELYLPLKFDLSIYSHIDNQDLTDHITRVGKVFYERRGI